jgi:hypothetical protein
VDGKIRIENREVLEAFLDKVEGFHDALLHEAVLLNTGYVDEKGAMHGDLDLPSLRLRIQSQFANVVGVDLDLKEVSILSLVFDRDFQMEGEILKEGVALYPCGKNAANRSQIRAKEISYQMLGIESRGPGYRLSNGVEVDLICDEEEPPDYPGAG